MDFTTIVIFLLIMGGIFYERLMVNTKKDADRKKKPQPTSQKNFRTVEHRTTEETTEKVSVPSGMSAMKQKKYPMQEGIQKKKQREAAPRAKGPSGKTTECHPAITLRNASGARRAFIYSEIFRRRYE